MRKATDFPSIRYSSAYPNKVYSRLIKKKQPEEDSIILKQNSSHKMETATIIFSFFVNFINLIRYIYPNAKVYSKLPEFVQKYIQF